MLIPSVLAPNSTQLLIVFLEQLLSKGLDDRLDLAPVPVVALQVAVIELHSILASRIRW